MKLRTVTPDVEELRNIIISSNLTSCYLILEELISAKGERLFYDKFRAHWIDIFKNVYNQIGQMRVRKDTRE